MISDTDLNLIRSKLPSDCKYFIAGGCLLPGYYTDVDIYFYSKRDYLMARSALGKEEYSTSNADSYTMSHSSNPWEGCLQVQLVHRSFGTPFEILSDFDLNKSRQAILLDNSIYQHPTFHSDLYFDVFNFRGNTIQRLLKYVYIKQQPLDIPRLQANLKHLLEQPLDTKYGHYYLVDEHLECTITKILYKALNECLTFFSIIKPIIESLPPTTRLFIYNELISEYTEMLPTPYMSSEFNLFTYIRNFYSYKYIQERAPGLYLYIPERELYQSVIDTYPEYLL